MERPRHGGWGKDAALIAAAWAPALALTYNFCHLLFRCGCTWAWAGGAAACNVHHATGPRCPWCSHASAFGWVFLLLLVLAALAVIGMRGRSTWARIACGAAAFFVAGTAAGLAFALYYGYPVFFGFALL